MNTFALKSAARKTARKTAALTSVLALWASVAAPQPAYETGGIQLGFDLGLRLEAQDNRALDPRGDKSSFETAADLSFSLLTETPSERFSLNFGGRLRGIEAPDSGLNSGFVAPFAELRYDLESTAARLGLSASLRESDLSDNDALSDDGLEVIRGKGATRQRVTLAARLDWREDTPLGFGLFAQHEGNRYHGGTATGLDGTPMSNNHRNTLGASARMDLTPAATLDMALSYSAFDEHTRAGRRETYTLDNSLTLARPHGPLTFSLGLTSTKEGARIATALGQTLELPSGVLMGRIGATRTTGAHGYLTGAARYSHLLANGVLSIGVLREVTSRNEQDSERLNTGLAFGYAVDLSPLSALRLDASWAESEATRGGLSTTNIIFGGTYSRELTPDWDFDAGYRHRIREDDTSGRADSNTLFLELRRRYRARL